MAANNRRLLAISLALAFFSGTLLAGPLESETFSEAEGWQARIQIDCYTPQALCGNFNFLATNCKGDLVFLKETESGFLFAEKLTGGRCQPKCELWLSESLDSYRETCRGVVSGEGQLTAVTSSSAGTPTDSAPSPNISQAQRQAALHHAAGNPDQRIETPTAVFTGKFLAAPDTGLVNGSGVVQWKNGDRYEGMVVDGDLSGQGTYYYNNGDKYEGGWQQGKKTGLGRYTFADGSYWQGEYLNDEQTAAGRLVLPAGKNPLAPPTKSAKAPDNPTPGDTKPTPQLSQPGFKNRGECLSALGTDGATQCFKLFPDKPQAASQFKSRSECLSALGTDGATQCFKLFPDKPQPAPQFKSRGECLAALGTDGATQCFKLFPQQEQALQFRSRGECLTALGTDGATRCLREYP